MKKSDVGFTLSEWYSDTMVIPGRRFYTLCGYLTIGTRCQAHAMVRTTSKKLRIFLGPAVSSRLSFAGLPRVRKPREAWGTWHKNKTASLAIGAPSVLPANKLGYLFFVAESCNQSPCVASGCRRWCCCSSCCCFVVAPPDAPAYTMRLLVVISFPGWGVWAIFTWRLFGI